MRRLAVFISLEFQSAVTGLTAAPGASPAWPGWPAVSVLSADRCGDRVDCLHLLGELDVLVVHQRPRVEVRAGQNAVHPAALHTEVAAVVDREDGGFSQVLLEHMLLVRAVDAHHLEALVDGIKQGFGAEDLVHRPDQFAVVVVLVDVVRRLPAEVPGRFDLRGYVAEYVPDILMVDDRVRAASGVGLRPGQCRFVGRSRNADGGDAGDWPGPGEVTVDQEVAVAAGSLDQVLRGHPGILEEDLRVRGEAVAEGIDGVECDPWRTSVDQDGRQSLGAALARVDPDYVEARVRPPSVPATHIARPVLAAVENVEVTVEAGRQADAYGRRQRGVEVRGPSRCSGWLARAVTGDPLSGWVGGGRIEDLLFLRFRSPVPDRQ